MQGAASYRVPRGRIRALNLKVMSPRKKRSPALNQPLQSKEFLAPGAPCEINIDGKTMEKTQQELKTPTRFTFDYAAEHVYTLLLKKDCYPRFIRSEHYKGLLAAGIQPSTKKRFFGFGGPGKKKSSTSTAPNLSGLQAAVSGAAGAAGAAGCSQPAVSRRRGSDRSLTGSAHELAVCGITRDRVGHSHSQSNLSDIPYRWARHDLSA
ncbi:regulation of calcium ion export across plasma membrane [Homalodisca vitripennis]|nr:regulation of calcium ion export across plasma membrane [Homalodisca vitripennis]